MNGPYGLDRAPSSYARPVPILNTETLTAARAVFSSPEITPNNRSVILRAGVELEPDGREWTTIIHGVLTPDEARAFAAELIAAADGCTDEVTMGRWSNDA